MIRQTSIAQTLDIAAEKAKYDECAKKLLSYKANQERLGVLAAAWPSAWRSTTGHACDPPEAAIVNGGTSFTM